MEAWQIDLSIDIDTIQRPSCRPAFSQAVRWTLVSEIGLDESDVVILCRYIWRVYLFVYV